MTLAPQTSQDIAFIKAILEKNCRHNPIGDIDYVSKTIKNLESICLN